MQILGKITKADLALMEARGLSPKQAVDAILVEAKQRHPRAETVIINKAASHDGFDIIAL